MISVPFMASTSSAVEDPNQVVVCKYSHTPVVNEQAQTVIIISTNGLDGTGFAGLFPFIFSDQQNTSIATRFAEVGELSKDLVIGDECPPFQPPPTDACPGLDGDQPDGFQCEPDSETQTRDLGPLVDCAADTVTTLHQERTRTQEFNADTQEWEWGAFSDWTTVDTTVVDANDVQCPPEEPINPPTPPTPPAPPEQPILPNTGSPAFLGALGLMGAMVLAAGSTLFMRSRKVRVPKA
jgi:LPXTG-motif cell wall-anchored protein